MNASAVRGLNPFAELKHEGAGGGGSTGGRCEGRGWMGVGRAGGDGLSFIIWMRASGLLGCGRVKRVWGHGLLERALLCKSVPLRQQYQNYG